MFRVESNATQVAKRLREVDTVLTRAALAELESPLRRIQQRMKQPGDPVKYPIDWDTEKQRRAYFASDGFGGGIPYRRTNAHPDSFTLRSIRLGFELASKAKGSVYLYGRADGADISPGKKQSNIHKGRHPLFRPVVDEELKTLPQSILARVRLDLQHQ